MSNLKIEQVLNHSTLMDVCIVPAIFIHNANCEKLKTKTKMFWSCEKSWQVIKMLMRCRRTDNPMLERVEIPPCCMPQHLTLLNCVDIDVLKQKHVRCPLPSSAQAELSRGDDGGIPRPMSTYIAPEACYYLQREGRNQPSLYIIAACQGPAYINTKMRHHPLPQH